MTPATQPPTLAEAIRFALAQVEPLPVLWEKSLASPERKHNEARNTLLLNLRAALPQAEAVDALVEAAERVVDPVRHHGISNWVDVNGLRAALRLVRGEK
jgi:hypothetical protein